MAARIQLPRVSKFPARHFYSSAVLAGKPRVDCFGGKDCSRSLAARSLDHSTQHTQQTNHSPHHDCRLLLATMASNTTSTAAAAAAAVGDDSVQPKPLLSDYEQGRARNIERNNARLRQLGLIGREEERMSNDVAWGRCRQPHDEVLVRKRDDEDGEYNIDDDGLKKGKKRPRKPKVASPPREGSRKSRRLANQPALGEEGIDNWRNDKTLTTKERRAALVAECREARQRAANEVAMAGFQLAAKQNPTASYEHCLMRVRSMSEKALATRVRKKS